MHENTSRVCDPLPAITTSDLNKRPRDVLRRVAAGERLVVYWRHKPVATLQPLDGFVFQPFTGTAQDVFGWPFDDPSDQIAALTAEERALLLDGYSRWRVWPGRVHGLDYSAVCRALEDMKLRGLVTKTMCGNELTGRGLALREALLKEEGREP
jgi:antitoxin (DNA-binding transcriptional repressor) of toxin-antitoxin stability system